ncbi:hypothetical protein OC835_007863, partial [Tilletia horrida]
FEVQREHGRREHGRREAERISGCSDVIMRAAVPFPDFIDGEVARQGSLADVEIRGMKVRVRCSDELHEHLEGNAPISRQDSRERTEVGEPSQSGA